MRQQTAFFSLLIIATCLMGYTHPLSAALAPTIAPAFPTQASNTETSADPELDQVETGFLAVYNRNVAGFNRGFDDTLLKPVAQLYVDVVPKTARQGVYHFFSNLNEVPTFLNDVLQLHGMEAATDFWRFVINSTVGVLGLMDIAAKTGLHPHEEDFGLTLARWGYKKSAYFVIPFLGPSTIRDAIALPINYYFLSLWPYIKPDSTRYALTGLNIISKRAYLLEYNPVIQNASLNPFIFERNAYLQRRDFLIEENGRPEAEFFDEASHDPSNNLWAMPDASDTNP